MKKAQLNITLTYGQEMSKGNEQALVSLAAITGCLVAMKGKNCFSVVAKKEKLTLTLALSIKIGRIWFTDYEDRSTNSERMLSKMFPWNQWMEKNTGELTCGGLTSAAFRLAQDLEEKLRNKRKKKLVGKLKEDLLSLEMYATSDGTRFEYIEQGNIVIDKLQELMGWEQTNFVKLPKEE